MAALRKSLIEDPHISSKQEENLDGALNSEEIVDNLIGPVLVDSPVLFPSAGAVQRPNAIAVWNWLLRDIDPKLNDEAALALAPHSGPEARVAYAQKVAGLISSSIKTVAGDNLSERRLRAQLGGDDIFESLGKVQNAFKYQQLLPQAVAFGRAIDGVSDQNALKLALKAFPVNNQTVSAFMMHAAIGHVKNPHRLISVILDLAGSETQRGVEQSGFGPIAEALIAHAQNKLNIFSNSFDSFDDVELACRSIDQFNRLIRAISNITECDKGSIWAKNVAGLIREISRVIEPRITRVETDVRVAMRKPRSGPDVLDPKLMQEALDGMLFFVAVREARDSLALNSLLSTVWTGTGKDLEVLIERALDAFRIDPENDILLGRLNTGIELAQIRFNDDYANILRRARDSTRQLGGKSVS